MLGRRDALPGMVAGIQTFGELINFHPHIHAIATDGVFTPDSTFLCLPRIDKQLLLEVWKNKVFELFVEEGKIDRETAEQMRCWPHSGFSVDNSVYLAPHPESKSQERFWNGFRVAPAQGREDDATWAG